MRNIALLMLLILTETAPALQAQFDTRSRTCGNESLRGAYALSITGTRPAPFVLPPSTAAPSTIEQVVGVFIVVFDGNGSLIIGNNPIVKGSLSGVFPDQPGTGTYSVNPDCSGTFTINNPQSPAPLINKMVITSEREFRSVVISPQPVMISVEAKKIN